MIKNNPVKSDKTYVQIFKCHFDPFSIKWSKNIFCEIIFIFYFQTSPRSVFIGSDNRNWVFIIFSTFCNVHCSNFFLKKSKLFLGNHSKRFMFLQWLGAEQSLVKVDQVLRGVHPNRNSAMNARMDHCSSQMLWYYGTYTKQEIIFSVKWIFL